MAGPGDDLLITNGCQQALDLIGRVLLRPGDTVAVEDPLYTGLEESADGNGRATLRRSGGRRRHGCRATGAGAGARAAAVPGGDLEFPESDRGKSADGRRASAAGCGAPGERPGDRERRLWRVALQRRAAARTEATGRERRHGAAAQLFQGEFPRTAGGLGAWGRNC